jgi:C1A family cysteine protease
MERAFGFIKQEPDIRDLQFHAIKAEQIELPKSVDLSSGFSDCYDQGTLGSCTGNAIAAIVEYVDLPKIMPSRLFIYYQGRLAINTVNEDSGAILRDGIKSVNKVGVCSETQWAYDINRFTENPKPECYQSALMNRSVKYYAVWQTESNIKKALAMGYPIVFGFAVKSSFMTKTTAKTGTYRPSGKFLGGHAVVICGYDDKTQRFLIRNSWGTAWGKKGYFTMPYSEVLNPKISTDFWVIEKMI